MKIALGSDHVGVELKYFLRDYLTQQGHECVDYGCEPAKSADYPIYGEKAGRAVASGECERGIVICGTGFGISLAANSVKGIRCVNCSEPFTAKLARQHNNANMLALGARVIGTEMAKMIVDFFLNTEFESGGRHERRVNMLSDINRD